MAQAQAQAALSAQPVMVCAVLTQRITITPGSVFPGGLDTYGPLVRDPSVTVSATIDGIYDT